VAAAGIVEAFELVEVDLHQQARRRVLAALRTLHPGTRQVTYCTTPDLHLALTAQLASVVGELGGPWRCGWSWCRRSLACWVRWRHDRPARPPLAWPA
jgi:hypothetical protein